MGCWNATCGISHLPIRHGHKVKAYILVPHHLIYGKLGGTNAKQDDKFAGSGMSYPNEAYSPLTWPIQGEYNDYGSLENIKNDLNVNFILDWVNKEFGKAYPTIEEMVDHISQGDTTLGLMMIHSSIYDAAVDAVDAANDSEYRQDMSMENVMEDFELAREYLQTNGAQDSLLDGLSAFGIKSAKEEAGARSYPHIMAWPKREGADRSVVESFSGGWSSSDSVMNSSFSREYFQKMLKSNTCPIEDMVGHFFMCRFFNSARRTWITQSGAGSQCEEYKIHRMVAEATLAHIEEVKQKHAEDIDLTIPEELEYFNKLY